jgi:hypothetical protein
MAGLNPGQNVNGTAAKKYSGGDARTVVRDYLFEFREDFLLILHDRLQGGLILQNGGLVFLDRFLIGLERALVRENRLLVLQNLVLVCDHIIL